MNTNDFGLSTLLTRPLSPRGVVALSLLALASGCSMPADGGPEGGVASDEAKSREEALQREVDTLLNAYAAFDESERSSDVAQVLDVRQAYVNGLLDNAVELAQRLQVDGALGQEDVKRLSMIAGQVPVQIARMKRALGATSLDAAARKELGQRLERVRLAARSLGVAVNEYQYASGQTNVPNAEQLGQIETLSGPLFPGSDWYYLDEGHVDIVDLAYEEEELEIHIHDESVDPDVERDPAHTLLVVKSSAKVQVPDSRYSFIGPNGATFWLLPESQFDAEAADVLWSGVSTEEIEEGIFLNDSAQIRFKEVLGPNGFSMFLTPADGVSPPTVVVDSENGLPDTITLPVGLHRHYNWAFESAGVYLVKVEGRGRLDGVPGNPWVTSAPAILKFIVLP
jgi:surface-anchored protein